MRSGSMDKALLGAVLCVGLLVVLAMYQIDRQWMVMEQLRGQLSAQTADIQRLQYTLQNLSTEQFKKGQNALLNEPESDGAFERAKAVQAEAEVDTDAPLYLPLKAHLKTLTPLISGDLASSRIQEFVLESLLSRDPDTLQWQGLLAHKWTISEDGLTFDFWLRRGLRFSDGVPVTAEDVAFSFDFLMDERIAAPRSRAYFQKIASVEAILPNHVRFHFKEPYYNALALAGGMQVLAKHYYQRFLEDPQSFNQSKALLFGSGPYLLEQGEKWRPDRGQVKLTRNPRYWGPVLANFKTLTWRVIENESALLSSFRNGDIHLYDARPKEFQDLSKDPEIKDSSRFMAFTSMTAGYRYVAWNQKRAGKTTPFADKKLRLAMTLLTDRQRIADELMLGYAEVAASPFSSASKQHDPKLAPRAVNREKALQLLAEAGYLDRDNDGQLENAEGEAFSFELTYFQDSQDTQRIVLLLKDLYAEAGINLIPDPAEWSVMLEKLDQRQFDAITLGWSGSVESDLYQIFHSSQIEQGGDNFIGYSNLAFDRYVEQARRTVDESVRMDYWRRAEKMLYDDQPYTFLFRKQTLHLLDKDLQNVQATRIGSNVYRVPTEVYWRPSP